MHSKMKGTIGEVAVVKDLYLRGYSISKPIDDLAPFDLLVVDLTTYFIWKVQVKSCEVSNGAVAVPFQKSNWYRRTKTTYTKAQVDIFALYVRDLDQIFYVSSSYLAERNSCLTLRIEPPKRKSVRNIRYAKDFSAFPPLVGLEGLEPSHNGLKVHCSAAELQSRIGKGEAAATF